MNVENILAVAQAIEDAAKPEAKPDFGFNMACIGGEATERRPDRTGHNCDTVACIAGWAIHLFPGSGVAEALGISDSNRQLDNLIMPPNGRDGRYTVENAVAVLRHLAATGVVDWTVGAPA